MFHNEHQQIKRPVWPLQVLETFWRNSFYATGSSVYPLGTSKTKIFLMFSGVIVRLAAYNELI